MKNTLLKNKRINRRKMSVRRRLKQGRNESPRLSVHRSCKHISAQIIDDESGKTLAHATSTAKSLASELTGKTKSQRAAVVGAEIAKKAKDAGVERVVFDRGASRFHGRIKALADAAREGGLNF